MESTRTRDNHKLVSFHLSYALQSYLFKFMIFICNFLKLFVKRLDVILSQELKFLFRGRYAGIGFKYGDVI